jgi:predicted transcriptional regulator of viral defense system
MAKINTLELPTGQPFDHALAMDRLKKYRAPRDRLARLCQQGKVVRVRQGLFVPVGAEAQEATVDPLVLSGLIFGPSYVSLETALARYGLLLERVTEVTCITSKRAKNFETPVGRFSYMPVNEQVFPLGLRLESAQGGSFFLAEPEKALCDRIAQVPGLTATRDVSMLLEQELRMEVDEIIRHFRLELVQQIAAAYRRKNVAAFARWLASQSSLSS